MMNCALPENGPDLGGMRSQSFCSLRWIHSFASGIASSTFRVVPDSDDTGLRFIALANELSTLLSRTLPACSSATSSWGAPRAAEGVQISYGHARTWHADPVGLGRMILTVTLEGDGHIGIRSEGGHDTLWLPQHPDYFYAIWGGSLDPTEHCVMVDSALPPRLSLTFRYILGDPVSPPANTDGSRKFQVGDRVLAFWMKGQVLYPGKITAICHDERFNIQYDDGDYSLDLPLKYIKPELPPEAAARNLAACERASRNQRRPG